MEKINPRRVRPIRDEVYDLIHKAIMDGSYPPGTRLQEEKLAAALGVSRTPVREALRKLEVEKMVVHYPHRGTEVSSYSLNELDELHQVRTLIESFIAKKAAQNATPQEVAELYGLLKAEKESRNQEETFLLVEEYNTRISEIANSPSLVSLNQKVRDTLKRMILSSHLQPEWREIARQEHYAIVKAMEHKDGQLAQELTVKHLNNAIRILRDGVVEEVDRLNKKSQKSF